MQLFHFTLAQHLYGISKHGLTVGDVVIDILSFEGKIGVGLTASATPEGHGLGGSAVDKTAYRLGVNVPDAGLLWKWTEWAAQNLSVATIELLTAGDAEKFDEFYVYFGHIPKDSIVEVVSIKTGQPVADWRRLLSKDESAPAVSYRARHTWHKRTMRNIRAAVAMMAVPGAGSMH